MKLTASARKHIAPKNFALPGGRYPIEDRSHAANALARVSQHGTPSEKARVRAAVHRKFPGMGHHATGGMAGYADGGEVAYSDHEHDIGPIPPQTESPEKHCATCVCNGGESRDAGSWQEGKTHHKTNLMSHAMRTLMTEGD